MSKSDKMNFKNNNAKKKCCVCLVENYFLKDVKFLTINFEQIIFLQNT